MLKLTCATLAATLFATALQAQTSSDSMLITGDEPEVCTMISEIPDVVSLNVASSGSQDLGRITYRCNSPDGFTRTISSDNAGMLRRGSQSIPYQLSHSGAAGLAFSATSVAAPLITRVPGIGSVVAGEPGFLAVTLTGSTGGLLAGEYQDTITVEIAAN